MRRARARHFGCVLALTSAGLLGLSTPAGAHHGKDFLIARTAEIPHPGDLYLISKQDFVSVHGERSLSFAPTLLYGLTHWMALEVHSHVDSETGEGFIYESTAPALHLSGLELPGGWAAGLLGEYEFAQVQGVDDRVEASICVSGMLFVNRLLTVNLLAERERSPGARTEFGYAVGFQTPLAPHVKMGVEGLGGLTGGTEQGGLVGLYLTPWRRLSLNLGLGTSLEGADGVSVQSAVIWDPW